MFTIFKSFSKEELVFFEEYLKTDYFNGSHILINLYQNMLEVPEFDKRKIIRNAMDNKSISGRIMSEKLITEHYYKLINKAKEFLSFKRFYFDQYYKNEFLLSELAERNENKSFLKLYYEMHTSVLKEKDSTTKYYRLYNLYEKYYNFTELNYQTLKHEKSIERIHSIQQCAEFKSIYYFFEEVSIFIVYLNNKYTYNISLSDHDLLKKDFIKNLYNIIPQKSHHPLVNLYFLLFNTYSDFDDQSHYWRYKNYYLEIFSKISVEEITHHFQFLITYNVIKKNISSEKTVFQNELAELYKIFLENKYYTFYGGKHIQTRLLLNIIKFFKSSGDLDWLLKFINKNSDMLIPQDRKNVKLFIKVYQYFLNSNFLAALNELNQLEINQFTYKYEIQTLKIRILYSLGEENDETVLSNIATFRLYLKSCKFLSSEVILNTLNFLKYVEKLILVKIKSKLSYIHFKLKKDNNVYFKDWLLKEYDKAT